MLAVALAQEFQRKFKSRYGYYPYAMKNVQEGKWWSHFSSFCDKSKLEDGKESEFTQRLFDSWENEEKIYPYVLSQELASQIEQSMFEVVETEPELTESDYINMTLKKANVWASENRIYNNKLGRFLTNTVCIAKALRGEFYKPIFMFCSDFIRRYGDLSEEDVLKKSSIRAFHPELYNALKTALKEKFVD